MANAGSAFWDSYVAVRRSEDDAVRTGLFRNADTREQQKHELDMKEKEEIRAGTKFIADSLKQGVDEMAALEGPGAAPAAAAPPPRGLQPPAPVEGVGPPSPDGTPAPAPRMAAIAEGAPPAAPAAAPAAPARRGPSFADRLEHGRKLSAKIMPEMVRVLAKTNPAEAAKLAAMVADPAQQDRIAKSTALVSLIKFNSMDPDIPQLFHEMHPEAVPGSYRGMPPDKTGMSGYGQYDVKGADGVIRTQMFTPADLDNAIMSTVSPAKMYEMALAGKEGERKGEETKSDIEFKKKRIGLLEKEYDEGGPQRQATLEGTRARTAHERATTGAIGDTKVAAAEAKGKEAGIKTWMRMHGVDNAMMQDKDSPQRKEVFNSYADAEDIAAANPTMKKMDSGTMLRLKKVMEDIAAGSDRVYKKKGTEKYVYNPTDDPGSEIAIPSHLVTAMKKEAEKKGAPVKRGVF